MGLDAIGRCCMGKRQGACYWLEWGSGIAWGKEKPIGYVCGFPFTSGGEKLLLLPR